MFTGKDININLGIYKLQIDDNVTVIPDLNVKSRSIDFKKVNEYVLNGFCEKPVNATQVILIAYSCG